MLSAVFAVAFGLSLLPGRKPLCLRFAAQVSGGILPPGAARYCRRLTWVWFATLALVALVNVLIVTYAVGPYAWGWSILLPACVVPLVFCVEKRVRDRVFSVTFRTSGSTGASKTIVKTFASLAQEVAWHRDFYRARFGQTDLPRIRLLSTVDAGHMYGTLWRVMLPAALGLTADPEVILAPEVLLAKMQAAEKVFLVTTPSFLARFTAYAEQMDVPRNCVEIVTSGALLTDEVSRRTADVFGCVPRQIYGSTETGGVAHRRGEGPWQVFPGVRVRAVASKDATQPRLAVRSAYSFRTGWYVTGDGVALAADGRTFALLGRMDRLVKINEERVNLAEMETRVRALGYADCALAVLDGKHGPVLGAVLVPPPSDEARALTPDALALRRQMLPVFPKGTVPKRFRFVHELPRNAQGKVVADEIVRLLESALVGPRLTQVRRTADEFSATLVFGHAAPYFQGHFPDAPILPGVVQLGFAVRCAQLLRGKAGAVRVVKKMKFMHIVEPDEAIAFRLVRSGEDTFTYSYSKGENLCASGVLAF